MPSNSLWLDGNERQYAPLRGAERADVAILGGGIAGLTAAYLLSAAGVGVAVIEADTVCGGASGHTAAHVTSQHGLIYRRWLRRYGSVRAGLIARANEDAIRLAAGIAQAEEISCGFMPQDSFVFTEEARREAEIEAEAEAASALGIMADVTNKGPFLFPYAAAVRFHLQAALHPVKYVSGLARAVIRNGGRIYERSRAVKVTEQEARTVEGAVKARCMVVATSFPIVNIPGWYPVKMGRRRTYAAALEGVQPLSGLWTSCDRNGYSYRGQEGWLIVCGGDHRSGDKNGLAHYDALLKNSLERFPGSKAAYSWSAQYADTIDGLPYIGLYSPKTRNMFVAAGMGRWGMTQGTLAGRLLCDLILDKKNPYAEIYSPQRAVATAAWGSAAALNLNTAWQLVSSGFRQKKNPVCSHFGCKLNWNDSERSWDCPCHGSRFDENGKVLDSPAVKDISPQKGP